MEQLVCGRCTIEWSERHDAGQFLPMQVIGCQPQKATRLGMLANGLQMHIAYELGHAPC